MTPRRRSPGSAQRWGGTCPLASVDEDVTDPHVVFIPLNESTPLWTCTCGPLGDVTINLALRAVLDELLTLNDGLPG